MKLDISKWALDNKKLIYFIIAVLSIGGIAAYFPMSKLEDPKITIKQAVVVAVYPGASPYQMELEVVDKLEKGIQSLKMTESIESRSMNDMALIKVTIDKATPENEVSQCWDVLRRKVADIQPTLPSGTRVMVQDDFGDVYGLFYAMTIDGFSDSEANRYAEHVKRNIQEIKGVSQVQIYGVRNECVFIDLSEEKMAALGVLPLEVISTLKGQNQTIYAGYYESGDNRIRVSISDRYRNIDDIGNLLIQGHEDDQLRLRDIAMVSEGYETAPRNQLFYDGRRAFGISISAKDGTDITSIGREVERCIENLKETTIPAGIEFKKVFFQSERVSFAINTFLLNLLESVVIVILILMLTMGFRSGIIIGKTLIFTVLGSICILYFLDGTLQRVSLGSFIVAMGMLVDNSIVIVDGILVDKQRGIADPEALTAIGRKTAFPLLGATLIAICAFLPAFLSNDSVGTYIRDLFIVLAVSLLLSWILALMYVPVTAQKGLRIRARQGEGIHESKAHLVLRKTLEWSLDHRILNISITILLVATSVYFFKFVPREFFPDMEYDQAFIEYKLPEGTSFTRVQRDLNEIESYLHSRDEVTHVVMSLGGTPSRYNLVRSIANPSYSYGELIVDFKDPEIMVKNLDEIQEHLNEAYPDAIIRVKRYNIMYKDYPIELQFVGPDPAVLKDLTSQAIQIMKENPNCCLVGSNWEPESPEIIINYDQPTARRLGLTRSDVGISILSATDGIPTSSYYDGWQEKSIYLRSVDKDGNEISSLENARVFSMLPPVQSLNLETVKGLMMGTITKQDIVEEVTRTVPLSQASQGIDIEYVDPVVIRYDGERAMQARCHPASGMAVEAVRQQLIPMIEQMNIPEGYYYEWCGEHEASTMAAGSLFANVPVSIAIILALIIALFKDYKRPIIIFCCLPLIAIGVVPGILLSGKAFGFVAIVGCLGLIGMLIKNAVILMDEIDLQLSNGVEPKKALIDSSASRFRPVMMASLTTILGMLPLLGDCLFGSLAVTIMAGLLVGTLVTLLFIPILYSLFFKFKMRK